MEERHKYINVIRRTVTLNAFLQQYFLRIVVVYLLSKGVTPWVAVSIPVVLEIARLISRASDKPMRIALKVEYKKYHIFCLVSSVILCLIISMCRNVVPIYFFTIVFGIITGINNSCITGMSTSNSKNESYYLFEEERAFTIGATLGLVTSQTIYDISPNLYILGIFVIGIVGLIYNSRMVKIVIKQDDMTPYEDCEDIPKKDKRNIIVITVLYAIFVGLWCIGVNGLEELAPLLTTKTGYLTAVYTGIELIALFIINGAVIAKIKSKNKLLFWEVVVGLLDVVYLLIASVYQNMASLILVYALCGISSTLGDPLWGSIVSRYSMNDRKRYVLVNKIFFFVRTCFAFISWWVCRQCVISGIGSFTMLAIILITIMIIIFLISDFINQRIFGTSI